MEVKILLKESEMPREWYNIQPDLPSPLPPPLHPGTKKPIGPDDLKAIFPMALIEQEMSQERWIKIPEEVLKIYTLWRPSPVYRALRLEEALKSPAKIYYKYEGVSPAGSHKPNTAVPQAYYNQKEGVKRIATETGGRPVGERALLRHQAVRDGMHGLHGQGELRTETLPAEHDGDLGRESDPEPQQSH